VTPARDSRRSHRFRNKFVTIIIHKPAHPPLHEQHMQAAAAAAAAAATSQQQQQQQQQQQFAALQQQQQQQGFALGWTGPPGAQALPAELAPPGPPQRGVSWSSDLMDSSATLSPGRAEMPPPPPPHHTRLAATPGDALPPPLKLPGGPPGPSGGGVAPNGSDAHGLESMDVSRPGSQAAFMDASMGMPPMGALPPGVQMDVSGAMGGAPPFGTGWPLGGVPGAPPHTPFGGAPPPVFGVGPVGPDSHVHGGNAYGRSSAPADQQHHHHAGGHRTDVVMR
jgi:type II secretory pathway pseudopilin PulG